MIIHNKAKHIKEWTEENAPTGKRLGYPDCCIREFCEQPPILMRHSKPSKDDHARYKAGCINGKFTGFIPCKEHAKQIAQGRIRLVDLIDSVKRDNTLPGFPFA
jgi:hypothetical protein